MKSTGKKAALAVALYLSCWLAAHFFVFLMNGDGLGLEYLISYFWMAWSFNAGELPSFIWLLSLILFAVLLGAWALVAKVRRNRVQSS